MRHAALFLTLALCACLPRSAAAQYATTPTDTLRMETATPVAPTDAQRLVVVLPGTGRAAVRLDSLAQHTIRELLSQGRDLASGTTLGGAAIQTGAEDDTPDDDSEVPDDITVSSAGAVDAAALKSGAVPDARVAESNVTQHQGAITITESQISDLKNYATVDIVPTDTDDFSEGVSNLFFTNARVGAALVAGANVTLTTDGAGITTIDVAGGAGGDGATNLSGLTDVRSSAPAASHLLIYNTDSTKYVNRLLEAGDLPAANALDSELPNQAVNTTSDVGFGSLTLTTPLATNYIANLDASKTTTGVFTAARIPTLDAGKIGTGTLANARVSESSVTQHEAALSIAGSQLTGTVDEANLDPDVALYKGLRSVSTNYTLQVGDEERVVIVTGASNVVITLPPTGGLFDTGDILTVYTDAGYTGTVTFADGAGVTSDGTYTLDAPKRLATWFVTGVDEYGTIDSGGGGASALLDLSDVGTATPTARHALMGDGTDFDSRALVEADISDLAHTTDTNTNASTECSGTTTYLDGEGNCDDVTFLPDPSTGTAGQVLETDGTNYVFATDDTGGGGSVDSTAIYNLTEVWGEDPSTPSDSARLGQVYFVDRGTADPDSLFYWSPADSVAYGWAASSVGNSATLFAAAGDVTAPPAINDLVATGGAGQITLTGTYPDPVDNDLATCTFYRHTSSGAVASGSSLEVISFPGGGSEGGSFTIVDDGGLDLAAPTPSVTYFYQIECVDEVPNASVSNEDSDAASAGLTLLASDDFTQSNGTLLDAYTSAGGIDWVLAANNNGMVVEVFDGRAQGLSDGFARYTTGLTPADADYRVCVDAIYDGDFTATGSPDAIYLQPTIRYIDGNNLIAGFYHPINQEWTLEEESGGVGTTLATSAFTVTPGTTYELCLETSGTTVKMDIDGVEEIAFTTTAVTAVGQPSLRITASSGSPDPPTAGADNFEVYQ